MAGDLFTQRTCRAGKRLYSLVKNPHIVGVADVRLKDSRIDPNPPRLDRSSSQQLLGQMLSHRSPWTAQTRIEDLLERLQQIADWTETHPPSSVLRPTDSEATIKTIAKTHLLRYGVCA